MDATVGRFELFDYSPDAIAVTNAEGVIIYCNRRTAELFGYDVTELCGQPIEVLVPRAARGRHAGHRRDFMQSPQARPMGGTTAALSGEREDGSSFPVDISLAAMPHGKGRVVIAAIRDISDRVQLANDLRAMRNRAEEANRAKSEFVANMSHELRTPMNGVIGMTDLCLASELTLEQRRYLGLIKSSAHALLGVIDDILDFSKIEAGKLTVEYVPFDPRAAIGDACKALALQAAANDVELIVDIDERVPRLLRADPTRLRQILVNLVGNAIKFTPDGEVVVSLRPLPADADLPPAPANLPPAAPDDALPLQLSVRDTGIGIAPEAQAKIFSAFTQADGSTTRRFGGTGLGLAIVARLTELLGGTTQVQSEPGVGSTLSVSLRALRCDEPPNQTPLARAEIGGLRVLIVDDNATNREVLTRMLEQRGARPVAVDSGRAALELLAQARAGSIGAFDAAIIDVLMPGLDGFAVSEQLRALGDPTPILLATSAPSPADRVRCRSLGILAYLSKPLTSAELVDALANATCATPAAGDPQVPAPPALAVRSLRVLVAEDNAVNRLVACKLLERRGHRVEAVEDGRAAVERIASGERFDAILMDIQMPELDGYEATQALRKQDAGATIPIIALTAHALGREAQRCLAAGMDAYISKPIDPATLFATLEDLVGTAPDGAVEDRPPA